ncbi:MAG: cobalamin-dependent protein [Candidatus Omnitrophica bacterium]|nr:cobalamin-dependent protein [Candidatus Omnitrophota bacterium]
MKFKNVALVFAPYPIPRIFPNRVQIPLGLSYIAANLIKHGYQVRAIDSVVEGAVRSVKVARGYVQYGLSLEDIVEILKDVKPDIVGLSCMFGIQLKNSVDLARMIKLEIPGIPIAMGGAHASAIPDKILKDNKEIDYVVIGEGEETFVNLLSFLNGKRNIRIDDIGGIGYRDRSDLVIIKDKTEYINELDSLPFPARTLFPMEKYFRLDKPHGTITKHKRSTPIITSRGCPAKCTFCSIHSVWGRTIRKRSPESVVDEIIHLKEKYKVGEFQIEDDNFTSDPERAERICDLIIERDLKVYFTTPNGVAIWALNKKLLQKMKRAGFYRLTLAIESGSEHTLKELIKKPLDLKQIRYIVNEAYGLGFIIDTFFVIGFPGEDPEEMKKTFSLARGLNVHSVKYFIATPYAGTDLYETAKDKNMLIPGFNLNDFDVNPIKATINTEYYSARQLDKIWFKETLKIQLILLARRPLSYMKDIASYILKNIRWP